MERRSGPWAAQVVEDAPIVSQDQRLLGERGPQSITAQAFQAQSVLGCNSLGGMNREAGDAGAEWLWWWLRILAGEAELQGRHGRFDRHGQGLLEGGGGRP